MISTFFIIFIFHSVLSQDIDKENEVFILNSDNFDDMVTQNDLLMVNFYAPWCQYSKQLQPHFERVAQDFAAQNKEVRLGKVDIVEEVELAKRFSISRYPTVIFFKEGRRIFYNKTNNYVSITNWLDAKTEGLVLRVSSEDGLEEVKKRFDVILAVDEAKRTEVFDLAAENIDDVQFIAVDSVMFPFIFIGTKDTSMVVFRKVDRAAIPHIGEISMETIERFILSNDLPPVVTYSGTNGPRIFNNIYKPMHFLLFFSENAMEMQSQLEVAATNHKKVRFAMINVNDNVTVNIVTFFKVNMTNLPYMILSDTEQKKTFKPDFREVDGRRIDDFVAEVKKGNVDEFLRSQPVPDNWDSEPLKVLVGKNFEQVAYDKRKHVFVEFYAPWCTHCKQLAPVWERLAKSLAHVSDLIIAKLDKTENDIKNIEIKSFPTLKLFLKDSNEMISYSGLRTKDALVEFLSKYMNLQMENQKQEL